MLTYSDDQMVDVKNILLGLKRHKFHFLGWAVFLFYEVLLVGLWTKHFSSFGTYFTHYALNISLFYVHAHVVMKYALRNSKGVIWKVPLSILVEAVFYLIILFILQSMLIRFTSILHQKSLSFNYDFVIGGVFRFFYLTSFSSVYYFLITYLSERRKTTDLETQRLENLIRLAKSENAYLRAQVNPHFLFNTLDFVYHNAKDSAPIAAEAIAAISGMMRYAVDETNEDEMVPLGREIDQVEQLIYIHQLKDNHELQIRFWWEEEVRSLCIIPLVLITLAENIFKHGDLKKDGKMASIKIELLEEDLLIRTENLINPYPVISGYGSGLDNIIRRLNHAYGHDAKLESSTTADNYFHLKIRIKNVFKPRV